MTVVTANSESSTENTAISLLLGRASAIKLAEPGPSRHEIEQILQAAVTAADHGRIRPWRFVVMTGDGRGRLGNLMAEAKRAANPEADEAELEKARQKAFRAPVVIALLCEPDRDNYKVPVIEQQLATGAAGAQMMLAAKMLGFGSNWKTGAIAHDPKVVKGLGFPETATITGFFYIGSEPKPSPLARATIDDVVEYWVD